MSREGRSRNQRRRPRRPGSVPARRRVILGTLGVAALGLVLVLLRRPGSGALESPAIAPSPSLQPGRSAILIDQLSLTAPNPGFVTRTTALLEEAGFRVDYLPGEQVSVDLYRNLPLRGDAWIVLRSHSARIEAEGGQTDDVALFTGEIIDPLGYALSGVPPAAATAAARALAEREAESSGPRSTYPQEVVRDLIPVFYDPAGGEMPHFGLRPSFIERQLLGRFEGSPTLVMMGCDGLRSETLARAFLDQGVGAFVSWTEPVSAPHTDRATERLLELLLRDGQALPEAVERTREELGPDPNYHGELTYVTAATP